MKSAYLCRFSTPYLYVKKFWLRTNIFRPESKVRLLELILAILKNICKQPKFEHIKFIYSEKATKFEKYVPQFMSKIRGRFLQISAAFSKNTNLIKLGYKYFFKSDVFVKKQG